MRRQVPADRLDFGELWHSASVVAAQEPLAQPALEAAQRHAELGAQDAIARLDGDAVSAAYAYASAAGFYLADRHGEAALRRVYAAYNDEAFEGDAGPGITDRVLRAELGVSLRRFERELRESLLLGLYAR